VRERGGGSHIEVEWQLDAVDLRPVERWLAAAGSEPTGAGNPQPLAATPSAVTAAPRPAERLVDTYLDTADWRIVRSGHVLRIRHRAGRDEVTLKDMAAASSGLRQRLEVTEPLPSGDLRDLAGTGPVAWRLRALVGRRPLDPVLEVRTRRRPYHLYVALERVAEVALDETTIVVGDEHQPVRLQRVEVEADPAWVEPLKPLVDTLRRECGLRPATLSKFEAGLLAAGLRVHGPPDLGPTSLGENPTVGEVAYGVLRRNFAAMLSHEAGTRLGEDPEHLHDMRVGTRRMRAALSLFADALPVRAHHVRAELGWLADALGAVRDLDVQLERLEEWKQEAPEEDRAALTDLSGLLERERSESREHLLSCLDCARYERLVASFTTMLRQGPSRRSATARVPAVTAVPDLVDARHRSTVKAARRARRSGDLGDFHRLRIRAKRLRYALEFVSSIYDGQTGKCIRLVVGLQDALGLMQDARVAAARLHELATAVDSGLSPTTVFVMGGVAQRYRHESERLASDIPRRLRKLRGSQWRRLRTLMEHRRAAYGAALYRWPPGLPGTPEERAASPRPASPAPLPTTTPASAGDRRADRTWLRDPAPPQGGSPGFAPAQGPAEAGQAAGQPSAPPAESPTGLSRPAPPMSGPAPRGPRRGSAHPSANGDGSRRDRR
jgi:CHAD domain-containing protein